MPFKVSFKHYDVISTVIRVTWGAHKSKFASLSPSKNFHAVYHLVMTTHRVITGSLIKDVLHKFFCKFSLSVFCKFRPCSHYMGYHFAPTRKANRDTMNTYPKCDSLLFGGNFGGSVWQCSGKGEIVAYERFEFEVQVRPWVAICFLLIEKLSITGQKFSKCLKNGSDRLRKGQLRRHRRSFAPLQKSRRNHPSHVRREALSSIVLAGAFAQAIPQWIQGRDQGIPPPYFQTKLRPEGPKKMFLETSPQPIYLGLFLQVG